MTHIISKKQQNSKMCFVCGLKNDFGLQAAFYETEKNELIAIFRPSEKHQSYPGRLHGGIASTILDETIGRAVMIGKESEIWGVTAEFKIRYKKPIPLDQEIKVIARIVDENNRLFTGTGEIVLENGEVAATAEGKYFKMPIEKIADFDPQENEWKVVAFDNDPKVVHIPDNS